MTFKNKSQTMALLSTQLRSATILDQVALTIGDWKRRPDLIMAEILSQPWAGAGLIVRSSLTLDDTATQSLAGKFISVQNVKTRAQLRSAINAVVASYGAFGLEGEQVLVQPMLADVTMSGVALSRELGSARPYMVVNYSNGSSTTAVTGGRTNDLALYYHFRGASRLPDGRLGAVLRLLQEVEAVTGCDAVDIEFAFCQDCGVPVLLQARPLAGMKTASDSDSHRKGLLSAERKLAELLGRHPLCCGHRSVLGVMPDWNPAEIIGVRPRPLALSLYRRLVTDGIWADQRQDYGYCDLRGFPLLVDLLGLPFIDVRASFNSFVPCGLDEGLAERLVDYYLERLTAEPALHDKVEFEIVFSCYSFDLETRLRRLLQHGFRESDCIELERRLLELTRQVFRADGPWMRDRRQIAGLCRRYETIAGSDLSALGCTYWLLEDCRLRGTKPFAGLARAGFMAVQMLDSLVSVGLFSADDRRDFLMALNTVSTRMQGDLRRLDREAFLARYGHLRPGTYDVLSPRYDEEPDLYFGPLQALGLVGMASSEGPEEAGFHPDRAQLRELARLLRRHGFAWSAKHFLELLGTAIRDREQAKFEFTRNLSDGLAQFTRWGRELGFTTDELSYADIGVVQQCYGSTHDQEALLAASIEQGRRSHALTLQTVLPPLITRPDDIWGFHLPVATPTFVTTKVATGPTVEAKAEQVMEGYIVMLPNADPGFDWIFTRGIAGFVTAYGGANSHMAIRASELDLPAVIGAGERLFAQWATAAALKLDCANRLVEPLVPAARHEARRRYAEG